MPEIQSLPVELISYIFILFSCSRLDERCEVKEKTGSQRRLVLLGQVCSSWSRIVSTTPRLWTEVSIKSSKHLDQFNLTAAKVHLSFCGKALPLTLLILWSEDIENRYKEGRTSFCELVTQQHSTRWTVVDIRLPFQPNYMEFITVSFQSLTSLTELKISYPPEPLLDFRDSGIDTVKESMTTFPSLQRLTLDFDGLWHAVSETLPILESLTLPSLTTLTLLMDRGAADEYIHRVWNSATGLIQRSKPRLRFLHTTVYSNPDDPEIIEFLRQTPYLENADGLYLLADSLMELEAAAIAPKLTGLSLTGTPNEREVDLIMRVLSSRWMGGEGPLKRFNYLEPEGGRYSLDLLLERIKTELTGLEVALRDFYESFEYP